MIPLRQPKSQPTQPDRHVRHALRKPHGYRSRLSFTIEGGFNA